MVAYWNIKFPNEQLYAQLEAENNPHEALLVTDETFFHS